MIYIKILNEFEFEPSTNPVRYMLDSARLTKRVQNGV